METFYHLIGRDADPITWWQMCARATVIFCYAVLLYRLLPRRAFGSIAAADIVVVVIMGSSLSRALTGNAPLLPTLAAMAVLATLYTILAALASRLRWLSWLTKGRPVPLIRDGRIDVKAMRWSLLGEHDLEEKLRASGTRALDEVAEACLERDGTISVVKKG
jgi:uncharacterized membrane protein YcaP (DUF421 family)